MCALLVCLVLIGCPITEAPEERAPASTPPFAGGTTPTGGPLTPTTTQPPLPTTCSDAEVGNFRCKGDVAQICNA